MDQRTAQPLHSTWSKPEGFAKLIRDMNLAQLAENDNENDDSEGEEVQEDSILRSQGYDDLEEVDEELNVHTARDSDHRR